MKTSDVTKLLYKMFTSSTGTALCDSGGAYGRHWERNQKLTLKQALELPSVTWEINTYGKGKDKNTELIYTINVFKYLNSGSLELDEICKKFNWIQAQAKDWDYEGDVYGVSAKAGEYLEEFEPEIGKVWNTYNDSYCHLSQTLQGSHLTINGESYVLLQIHQGCDVRGGYTDAMLFKLPEGYLPMQDVGGTIGKTSVDNMYDGYSLTDEDGNKVKVRANSKISLYLMGE